MDPVENQSPEGSASSRPSTSGGQRILEKTWESDEEEDADADAAPVSQKTPGKASANPADDRRGDDAGKPDSTSNTDVGGTAAQASLAPTSKPEEFNGADMDSDSEELVVDEGAPMAVEPEAEAEQDLPDQPVADVTPQSNENGEEERMDTEVKSEEASSEVAKVHADCEAVRMESTEAGGVQA